MNTKWHRLNAGNYSTDPHNGDRPGTWVIYRYDDPSTGRPDGWMVCRFVATDYGSDLVSVEWTRTLAQAKAEAEARLA